MSNLIIREASLDDIQLITNLEQEYEHEQYSESVIMASIEDVNTITLLCFVDGDCVGYLSALIVLDECNLIKIIIAKNHRKCGYAYALLQRLIIVAKEKCAEKIFLEVRKDNLPAKNLYEKIGFVKNGIRKNYYNGVDAELYWYNI